MRGRRLKSHYAIIHVAEITRGKCSLVNLLSDPSYLANWSANAKHSRQTASALLRQGHMGSPKIPLGWDNGDGGCILFQAAC